MIFNKTTNFSFKKFGDSFISSDVVPEDYYLTKQCITNKFFNETYCFDYDIYLTSTSGYSLLVIFDSEKDTFVEYSLHRICKINKNAHFNVISITTFSNIDFYSLDDPRLHLTPFREYRYQEVISRINITKIIGCYNDFRAKGYYFKGEILQCFEFTYVFSGKMYMNFDDKEITLNAGHSIVFAPGDYHSKLVNEKSCSYLTIIFDMDIDENSKELLTRKVFSLSLAKDLNLNFLSQKTRSIYDNSLMVTTTQNIVISLLKSLHIKNHSIETDERNIISNEIIDEILSYISTEYKNIDSVEELCDKFFFSRSSMQKLIKEQLGVSPKRYIIKYKINKAIEILSNGNIPVSEVAKMVGFNDQHYFSRAFKKETGMSPREFKKEIVLHHI